MLKKIEAWVIKKKRTYEGPWVHEKKEEKKKETPEGLEKRERRRNSHALKRIQRERETIEKEFPSTIYHPPYPYTCTS